MNGLHMTPRMARREHEERLQRAARDRRAVEVAQRMRIQTRLRKAIQEAVRLNGGTAELAAEVSGMVRSVERRLSDCSCCRSGR